MPEPELDENRALVRRVGRGWRSNELRHGYSTSACAAAAAVAAVRLLLYGEPPQEVVIDLPAERGVSFAISRCESGADWARCGTIKDAGDDPDVTHGAEIVATACWNRDGDLNLLGGEGVGTVTRPGLPVPVGEPAINPGPRRLIKRAVQAELDQARCQRGVNITISVPGGAELAAKTLNPRLGIIGGLGDCSSCG